jgi:pyrroline-5-carboxylate reductase
VPPTVIEHKRASARLHSPPSHRLGCHLDVSDPATQPTFAFIGGGNMTRSLIGGLVLRGHAPARIAVAEPQAALREALAAEFGVSVLAANSALPAADVLVLAVKPQVMREVCAEIRAAIAARAPLVVSIAAGIRIAQLERWLGGAPAVVRAMPNTPALIGAGIAGLVANAAVSAHQRAQAEALLRAAGETVWIPAEALMDTVTAVSGSGPAYIFLLIEALQQAAEAQGLDAGTARALVVETALGAARMARAGTESAAALRQRVTSPGGTTQAALEVLEQGGFRRLVGEAIARATARGRELSDQHGD